MEKIEVDSDVFSHLQKHARPFVDTPNSTLRRLLGIDVSADRARKKSPLPPNAEFEELLSESMATAAKRAKAPKADLQLLVQKGFLRSGQKLYLIDYQGNRVQKMSVTISGADVIYNGQRYSMSNLAQELLVQVGFKSNSVRGPAHWVTDDGKSIKDIWQQFLDAHPKK